MPEIKCDKIEMPELSVVLGSSNQQIEQDCSNQIATDDLHERWQIKTAERKRKILASRLSFSEFGKLLKSAAHDGWSWKVYLQGEPVEQWTLIVRCSPADSMETVLAEAYQQYLAYVRRQGQINDCFVYVENVEKIRYQPNPKDWREYAEISVVKDVVDGEWRWATNWQTSKSGAGYAPSWNHHLKSVRTRHEALILAIHELLETFGGKRSKSCRAGKGQESGGGATTVRKSIGQMLEAALDELLHGERQPSLF
jgi:hypothetical protein